MTLETSRKQIDELDARIIALIAERMELCRHLEKPAGTIEDPVREEQVRSKWRQEAKKHGLSEDLALRVLEHVLHESKRLQSPSS